MVDERRRARNEPLREWIDQGASCPFCTSLRLDVDPTFELPKTEPQIDRDKPCELMRVNCGTCGYISFFDPYKFGPPRR
jgi:hypothetical protein